MNVESSSLTIDALYLQLFKDTYFTMFQGLCSLRHAGTCRDMRICHDNAGRYTKTLFQLIGADYAHY